MPETDPKIKELEERLDRLVRTQIDFQKEISAIRGELVRLHARRIAADEERSKQSFYAPHDRPAEQSAPESASPPPIPPRPRVEPPPRAPNIPRDKPPIREVSEPREYELPRRTPYEPDPVLSPATTGGDPFSRFAAQYTENARANLEKFIGANLISLIGIVVLVLGVGIGAKYAIDNDLISPLTRIVIGYIFGFGLVGLAIKLKARYHTFSAVLISGGMAIMYFVTYFAYAAYALISQLPAFGLMVMFTVATVAAALVYSRQVIAHIGLVGAYAVPFLLSSDSGNYLALFTYMALINAGILAVSVKKNWKPIFYTASLFTWAIFCGWFATKYSPTEHFNLALVFLGVFAGTFYATRLTQAAIFGEARSDESLVASGLTVVVFHAICFAMINGISHEALRYWTLFTYLAAGSVAIIATSIRFYGRPIIFYASAAFTWVTFCYWFAWSYSQGGFFGLVLTFLGVFFAVFFGATLLQARMMTGEEDRQGNLTAAIVNTMVFLGVCLALVTHSELPIARYWTFFTYVAVASLVILGTSFKFFGRALVYVVVPLGWAIFGGWFSFLYDPSQHFELAAVFASLFFATFYFSMLFHRLVEDSFTIIEHTSLVLANAFVFYGFGYRMLDWHDGLQNYLGLFTAGHAALHLAVALAVSKLSPKAIDVVQVLTVLVLTFSSIAIPVQFDGNLVTMIWAVEGAVLFWFGRTRGVQLFERFAYPVMILATGSMFVDWAVSYSERFAGVDPLRPFANGDFVAAAVFVASMAFVFITHRDRRYEPAIDAGLTRPVGIIVATVLGIALYNMFRTEIGNYFYLHSVRLTDSRSLVPRGDLQIFNIAWQINYTLFFLIAMAAVNLRKFRSRTLAVVNCTLAALALAIFASAAMFQFSELRQIYVASTFEPEFISHWLYVWIRPISYLLAGALLYLLYEYTRDPLISEFVEGDSLAYGYEGLAYTFVFIVASCELVNLMGQFHIPDATKLGLSILWGVYALSMIVIGIARDKKHLRIAAMALLGVTLAKLFFYDIADLDTIPKTILFVTLGITLLLVSFLYNKYKDAIFGREAEQDE